MPKKVHDAATAMIAKGMAEDKARAIAQSKFGKKSKTKKKSKSISEKRKSKDLLHYV
jgi:hypothetical protein